MLVASIAAFALAVLSGVEGFVRRRDAAACDHDLFGLRVAVPVITIAQMASSGGRVWFNHRDLPWRPIGEAGESRQRAEAGQVATLKSQPPLPSPPTLAMH